MTIIKQNGSPDACVEFVKSILPIIGHITSLEVYKNEEDIPDLYKNVPDINIREGKRVDCSHTYSLILRDDQGQEVWLSGCDFQSLTMQSSNKS